MRHRFRGKPAAMRHVNQRGRRRRKLVDVVQRRLKQFSRRNDPLRDAFGETCDCGFLAVDEKYAPLDRTACGDPSRNFAPVGVARIFVDRAYTSGHLDLLTLDPNGFDAIYEKAAEGATGLITDQQNGAPAVPQPALEVMPDTPGVAH